MNARLLVVRVLAVHGGTIWVTTPVTPFSGICTSIRTWVVRRQEPLQNPAGIGFRCGQYGTLAGREPTYNRLSMPITMTKRRELP